MKVSLIFLFLLLLAPTAQADQILLKVTELQSGNHRYFHELLQRSLEDAGHDVTIESLGIVPFKRSVSMLANGETTIRWFHRARALDLTFVPISVGLTDNFIGKRVLVVPAGTGDTYQKWSDLESFQQAGLVGGFAKGWYDVRVWEANGLKTFEKDGNWRDLFAMIANRNRGVDYISRGVGEVLNEMKGRDGLEIEPNLVFEYDSDFWFFLTPSAKHLKPIIEDAIRQARRSGLMDELIRKYWGHDLEVLKVKDRTVIRLENP